MIVACHYNVYAIRGGFPMPNLTERIGRAINELDIDFSRFTIAGWLVSATSLVLGLLLGLAAYFATRGRIPADEGPALAYGVTMIATTVVAFLVQRALLSHFGVAIVRERPE
jgi:hypothetical protein